MSRILAVAIPSVAVGLPALAARLLQASEPLEPSAPALFLMPLGIALVVGLWRPSILGSIGAWLGWSAGVALGWFIVTGELWIDGPAAYALIVAFLPHAIGSSIRTLLRPRASVAV